MNALYRQELRLGQNLVLPSVKLVRKERIGAKLQRVYDAPQSPVQRVQASAQADPQRVAALRTHCEPLDPVELARAIDQHLQRLYQLANHRRSPAVSRSPETPDQGQITPGLHVP